MNSRKGYKLFEGYDMFNSHPVLDALPSTDVSSRYEHICSRDVINKLSEYGWRPVKLYASNSNKTTGRHIIEFEPVNESLFKSTEYGGLTPRICMINSHDGSSSFQFHIGFIRLVCANGLTFGTEFAGFKIKHVGKKAQMDVLEKRLAAIAEDFSRIYATIQVMDRTLLSEEGALKLAELAWNKINSNKKDGVKGLLQVKRDADSLPTAWNIFNVIQEHLVANTRSSLVKVDKTNKLFEIFQEELKLAA